MRTPTRAAGQFLFRAVAACAVGVGIACGSSPTAPATPTTLTATAVIITGTSVLKSIGQTGQLAAKTNSGTDVTTQVTWQSANTAIATVTPTGLVTATGAGSSSITAKCGSVTGAFTLFVGSSGTTTLTACGTIGAPGTYALANDISSPPLPPGANGVGCLNLANVPGVQLDCGGHRVSSVTMNGASSVTITHCTIVQATALAVSDVTLDHNSLQSWFSTGGATRLTLSNNQFSGSTFVIGSTFGVLTNNSINIDAAAGDANAGIWLESGNNNQVLQNTLSGGYNGSGFNAVGANVGTDDGIVLKNETGDTVQGNSISNFYDAGIEGIDAIANSQLVANTITNVGVAGIGAYWCTNWTHNLIQSNDVTQAEFLADVLYAIASLKCGPAGSPQNFIGNSLVGNRFRGSTFGPGSTGMNISLGSGTASGNLIQGNDFGTLGCPALSPPQGFIDGGGNICTSGNVVLAKSISTHGVPLVRAFPDLLRRPRR